MDIETLQSKQAQLTLLRQQMLFIKQQIALLEAVESQIAPEYKALALELHTATGLATLQPGCVVATESTAQVLEKEALGEIMKTDDPSTTYLAIKPDHMGVLLTLAVDHASGLMRNGFQLNTKAYQAAVDTRYTELIKDGGRSETDAVNQLKIEFPGFTGFKTKLTAKFVTSAANDIQPLQPAQVLTPIVLAPDTPAF